MSRTRPLRWLVVASLLAHSVACGSSERRAPSASVDDFGAPIPNEISAQRVVSLGPSTTELLFALGVGSRLVGRSRWDGWPAGAREIPEVGDAIRPSVERVAEVRPDLVVLYAATDNRAAADAIRRMGIPVLALRIDTIDDYLRALSLLGRLTHTSGRASDLAAALRRELDAVRSATRGLERPRVFVRVWGSPLMTVGSASFLSELISIAGGENLYADREESALTVSVEDVVTRDPDVIAAGPDGLDDVRSGLEWRNVSAVRTGRLITFDTALTSQPTMRLGQAAHAIAKLLHPSLGER